jgi:hypothetical protein
VGYVVAALVVVALLVLYAHWTARRLDRLHARVDAAATALDAQLLRRASMTAAFASVMPFSPSTATALVDSAGEAVRIRGLGQDREVAENAVTRSLTDAVAISPDSFSEPSTAAREMHDEALRATFARRFYNDSVRDALVVRDRRVVRWMRLAGRAPLPAYFEMVDEELPVSRISVASGPTIEP